MTINRSDINTSADGADIFTIGTAQSPFTNYGTLTTSGDLASPIRVVANSASVTNKGTLMTSGDGSPGVVVGELFGSGYDHVTVINYGAIKATGAVYDDGTTIGVSGGIEFYAGDYQTGTNYGSISAIEGIGLAGSYSILKNYGTITAAGAGFYVEGAEGPLSHELLLNSGSIHTISPEGFSYGIAMIGVDDSVVKNSGKIQVDGFHDFGISMEGNGDHGENDGTILAIGEQARGVLMIGEGNDFINRGTISTTGVDSVAVRWGSENAPGTDAGTFTNYGSVSSVGWAVRGSDADEHVINRGKMAGDVDLGGGDDSYAAGRGGSLNGSLTLGDGNDLIVFQKGGGSLTVTDFAAGAGTDDVIDLNGFGFSSFEQIMGKVSQSGSDVVLKLGPKDQIILENVNLGSLSADDFSFGPATTLQQAFTPTHVHHGDNLFG